VKFILQLRVIRVFSREKKTATGITDNIAGTPCGVKEMGRVNCFVGMAIVLAIGGIISLSECYTYIY